jgi:thiamine biosynthesis lipoprotein
VTARHRDIQLIEAGDYWCAQFDAMASPCEILVEATERSEAGQLARLAANEAWRIEDKFSRYQRGNVVDAINTANGAAIGLDEETSQLIDFSQTLYELSEGRFDITSGALRQVWSFDGSDRIPGADAVRERLRHIGWHRASWERPVLRLPAGMEIDLGGIGKEYAVDRAAALLRDASDSSCLVNFGGDLAVSRGPRRRKCWTVGIEAARASSQIPSHLLRLSAGALATSGDSRRFVLRDGVRYGHILDAKTGWPVVEAPKSVTVAADTCTQAGMLCTLAMLRGVEAEGFLGAQDVLFWVDR